METLIAGKLYRHPKCLDIDLFICARVGANCYRVQYWNRFYRAFQGDADVVTIDDVTQWREVK